MLRQYPNRASWWLLCASLLSATLCLLYLLPAFGHVRADDAQQYSAYDTNNEFHGGEIGFAGQIRRCRCPWRPS